MKRFILILVALILIVVGFAIMLNHPIDDDAIKGYFENGQFVKVKMNGQVGIVIHQNRYWYTVRFKEKDGSLFTRELREYELEESRGLD